MSFTSLGFAVFLLAVLVLSRAVSPKWRIWVLLPASYFFYACHHAWLLLLIIATTLLSYFSALCMEKAHNPKQKRRILVWEVLLSLGLLFLFKYVNFTLDVGAGILQLLGIPASAPHLSLLLPIGISFYTFQTISYTIDVYRGETPAEHHLPLYALFVVFFPQLVAGPIERSKDLLPQLRTCPTPSKAERNQGLFYLLRGYAKKLLIADLIAPLVDRVYGDPASFGGFPLMLATMLFAIQIYCDFSGYSDIAVGCARLLGVRLSENFQRPYTARTIREFWQRWHISLTRWFRDYLYIPLGGSRKGIGRTCRNTLLVFTLSGLWHGANLTFVLWGLLHGLFLCVERLLRIRPAENWKRYPQQLFCFILICLSWVFFRADTLTDAYLILRTILTVPLAGCTLSALGLSGPEALLLFFAILQLPLLDRLHCTAITKNKPKSLYLCLLVWVLILARCFVLLQGNDPSFLYFQF